MFRKINKLSTTIPVVYAYPYTSLKRQRLQAFARRSVPALIAIVLAGSVGARFLFDSHADTLSAPSSGTQVCNQSILDSPYSYAGTAGTYTSTNEPSGLPTFGTTGTNFPSATQIIVVAAGDNTTAAQAGTYQVNNAIVYFEPGTHNIKTLMYAGHNTAYIGGYTSGAGKAIITGVDGATNGTGKGGNDFEASQASSGNNVYNTWEYLTIENYTSSENSSIMGNVNGGSWAIGDTYMYNTIGPNEYGYVSGSSAPATGQDNGGGYGIDMGSNTTVEYNCMVQNAQGSFNGGGVNDTVSYNEISGNGLGEYPDDGGTNPKGCGCSGGGKLFNSTNPTIDYNYVHDNYNTGIWLDFDNTGADISHNYISSNWGSGISYEASYNAQISDNTLVGNGWASDGAWPSGGSYQCYNSTNCAAGFGADTGAGGGNPYAAIDASDSGGNSNLSTINIPATVTMPSCASSCSVTSRYSGEVLIQGNVLTNNFGGVKVYTDTNRYPNNIDYDSACSVPLGSGANGQQVNSSTYYRQTKVLEVNGDAAVSGTTVTTSSGAQTLCSDYGTTYTSETDAGQTRSVQAPSVGMAVYDQNANTFLGTIASVSSANSFTLSGSPGNRTGASLIISAYGGCGPADYWQGGFGVASGTPSANYWDNCLWGSRNVTVSNNTFSLDASTVTGCTTANLCGYMENAAYLPGIPTLMQYFSNYSNLIAKASGGLGNVWSNNTYSYSGTGGPGSWQFWAGLQSHSVTETAWQASPYGQDAGSNFNGVQAQTSPPSTPTNVSATAQSATSVSVTWTASTDSGGPGLGGYYIYRNGTQVGTVNSTTTSYTDTTVAASTSYTYTVAAYDTSANLSAQSGGAAVTTPAAASQNPTVGISLTNNSSIHGVTESFTATLTPASGNTISQAQLFVDNATTAALTTTSSPYTFTINTTGYTDGSHTFTVKATDNHGNVGSQTITVFVTNGDVNGDGSVGLSDLSVMATHWNATSATYSQGDLNGDSKVNIADLSILASNWGNTW